MNRARRRGGIAGGKRMNPAARIALWMVAACCAGGCVGPAGTETQTTPAPAEPLAVARTLAPADGATVVRLSNGLTVIVKPVRTAPVVTVRAYVRAGGLYEGKYLGCGISHLTEHLVAKGAEHDMGPGATAGEAKKTSDRVSRIGGQSNAYTSLDSTCYYISASAGKTMECIDLVADWMARPEISRTDFEREHGVVQRELEMGRDKPSRQMWYAHMANAYEGHPAAVPVIGLREPLAGLKYENVLDYHARMYVPQNMVFCVVGNVDVSAVLDRACRAFAGFAPGREPDLSLPEARPWTGVRRCALTHPSAKETMESLSFQTVPLVHADLYALDVLSYVLTEGQASLLVRKVQRERKLVSAIDSSSWTPDWGKGTFTISFRCEPDAADRAERAILDELRAVAENGVTDEQLQRAKRQKTADYVYSQQTVDSQAATLASDYLSTSDASFSRSYTRKIQAVTAAQVQAAARKYFNFDAMTVTRMTPPAARDSAAAPTETASRAADGEFFKLPNGLRVVLHASDSAGLVSMTFVSAGGVLLEDEKTNGLGNLMASLSAQGAGERSAEEIAAFFDRAGGGISGSCGNNTFYWQATVLDDSFDGALDILADVILRPSFAEKELDILRPRVLAAVKSQDEDWMGQLRKFTREQFFTGSPYRLSPVGSEAVVRAATVARISEHHRRAVRAGSSVLAIYGTFDARAARRRIEALFAPLPTGEVRIDIPPARQVAPDGELHKLKTDNQQAALMVAVPGMTVGNVEDRFAMDVLDTILSGYQLPGGWLHNELRGRQLVYVVHAFNQPGLAPGGFFTYAACKPEKAAEVLDIIRRDYRRATEYLPSDDEVAQAVNTILTAELLDNQSMASLSMQAALDELYGLGHDFRARMERNYRRVTPEDVRRVARKYLGSPAVVCVTTPRPDLLDATSAGSEGK
ncbi:MAG TPA: hypothetical protein DCX07_15865 [Phycisphaerales bacterium]|nr:hypothetical protein [Phycisphaerales bacterium]